MAEEELFQCPNVRSDTIRMAYTMHGLKPENWPGSERLEEMGVYRVGYNGR